MARLARVVASQFEGLATERNIHFAINIPTTLMAQADKEKCQNILLNLLSNAFKFTPDQGEINFTLYEEKGRAVIQVSDSGPGIPADKRETIFERFRQLEGNSTRKHGGTGLGLSIVKEYVLLHHGQIHVGEALPHGALFTIYLPIAAPPDKVIESGASEINSDLGKQLVDELILERAGGGSDNFTQRGAALILVVEDNPDMSDFISSALSKYYRVSTAADGQAGLEKAISLKPDLILADFMMPNMSGDQMVQAIRQHPLGMRIPIVILTAKADEATRVELFRSGIQDYMNKPFSEDELLLRVENILTARKQETDRLDASELQYSNLFENMVEGFAYCRMIFEDGQPKDWIYLKVNPAFEELTGLKDVTGKLVSEIIPGIRDVDPNLFNIYARVSTTGAPDKFETYLTSLNMWFAVSVYSPEKEYFVAMFDVITERKRAEEQVKKSLAEKETLLRELYHRTKNNMAVIIALLGLQAASFEDERLQKEFVDAQNRIRSMALVHQKLYDARDLSRINLKEYISELVQLTKDSYSISPAQISVSYAMEDVFVLIDSAIPCGLIVNELISNALKHAFPAGQAGEIKVQLHRTGTGQVDLIIADNGKGVPQDFDFRLNGHLGIQNVFILVEHQLHGQVEFESHQGVTCRIRFQDTYYEARV
jgi:two-component sensor histidine kinase/CheY-like chemotaxis protein